MYHGNGMGTTTTRDPSYPTTEADAINNNITVMWHTSASALL